ncbi:MAG: dipeptidase [Firmicutes bacterium]|nr:dipeptidase [Bacillota bacterium]MCL5039849.1 dipeptidase [Bacillota bacterium]
MTVASEPLSWHQRAIVVDAHCDTLLPLVRGQKTLTQRSEAGHIDLPRLQEGGVKVQFFAAYVEADYKPDRALKRAIQLFDVFFEQIREAPQAITPATNMAEIKTAVAAGQVAAILAVEGGEAIQGDLGVLRMLYRLGVRSLGLTWNQRNDIADGVGEARTRGGLTEFGVKVVQEMNRLGLLVDVAHLSEAGFWDVCDVSEKPFVASHANSYALCPHRRNLKDEQIQALAEKGGVMGITFAAGFVDEEEKKATLARVLDHVEHVVSLVGPDHVGLGSDFDGTRKVAAGLEDVTRLPAITEGLWKRGFGEEDVRKILGGNFLRVLEEVMG